MPNTCEEHASTDKHYCNMLFAKNLTIYDSGFTLKYLVILNINSSLRIIPLGDVIIDTYFELSVLERYNLIRYIGPTHKIG
jgi:hypothetical protein